MSTFLFYKPNSNPGRYSRKERFSLRHTALSDNALNDGSNLAMKKPTYPEPACPSVGNELDLSIRNLHCTQSISTCAETLPQTSGEQDACRTSIDYDLDSLHSLFSAPDTDSESNIGVAESDEVHPAGLGLASIKDISPSESGYSAQISKGDAPHTIDFGSPNSLQRNCLEQGSWVGRDSCIASEPSDPMPALASHSANVSPSPILQPMYGSSIELTSSLALNEHLERAEDLVPKSGGDILGAETSSDKTSPKTSYLEAQDDISLPHNGETHGTSSADLVPDPPQSGTVAPAPFFVEERNLSTEGSSRPAPQASSGSPDMFGPSLWQEKQPHDGSCHLDIDCIDPTDCIAIPELDKSIIENRPGPSGLTNTAASQRCIDMEVQDMPHNPEEAPNGVEKTLSTAASTDPYEPDTQTQPSQQACFVRDASDFPADPTELPLSSVQGPRKYYEFSHVEIRNPRPSKMVSPSVETQRDTVASPVSSCHHLPTTEGPWHLNGTILSIDLRHADFPTRFGKSTFRVFGGQVIQLLTLVHGPIKASPPKTVPGAKISTKKRKLNRPVPSAGPLSSEQKQCLLRLREEGYTWNEIAARFPGRKKGTLQATYYTTLKKLHPSSCLPQQRSRRFPTESRWSHSPSQRLGHTRYSLRSRGSAVN